MILKEVFSKKITWEIFDSTTTLGHSDHTHSAYEHKIVGSTANYSSWTQVTRREIIAAYFNDWKQNLWWTTAECNYFIIYLLRYLLKHFKEYSYLLRVKQATV